MTADITTPTAQMVAWLASDENDDRESRHNARAILDALLFHELSQPHGGARERKPPRQQTGAVCTPLNG